MPSILLPLVSCGVLKGSTLSWGAVDLRVRFLVSCLKFDDYEHRVVTWLSQRRGWKGLDTFGSCMQLCEGDLEKARIRPWERKVVWGATCGRRIAMYLARLRQTPFATLRNPSVTTMKATHPQFQCSEQNRNPTSKGSFAHTLSPSPSSRPFLKSTVKPWFAKLSEMLKISLEFRTSIELVPIRGVGMALVNPYLSTSEYSVSILAYKQHRPSRHARGTRIPSIKHTVLLGRLVGPISTY